MADRFQMSAKVSMTPGRSRLKKKATPAAPTRARRKKRGRTTLAGPGGLEGRCPDPTRDGMTPMAKRREPAKRMTLPTNPHSNMRFEVRLFQRSPVMKFGSTAP